MTCRCNLPDPIVVDGTCLICRGERKTRHTVDCFPFGPGDAEGKCYCVDCGAEGVFGDVFLHIHVRTVAA